MYNTPQKKQEYSKKWRELNKQKLAEDHAQYYQENKEKLKQASRDHFIGYKVKHRENTLKRKYGIDNIQYEKLFSEQRGLCAICLRSEITKHQSGTIRRLAVDHDHETGKIRGLLCSKCNNAIGYLEDNVEFLDRAKKYLQKHK